MSSATPLFAILFAVLLGVIGLLLVSSVVFAWMRQTDAALLGASSSPSNMDER